MSSDYNPYDKESYGRLYKAFLRACRDKELYYCPWCGRHLPCEDGVYVHDDVYHDENFVFEEGHKLQ